MNAEQSMTRLVSAIITTHNRKELLEKAVTSVLNQSFDSIELIVVDDASTDGTEELIKTKYNNLQDFHYIRIDVTKGGNYARNVGIKAASGKYIGFLDDDDEWLPSKVEKQVAYLESNPGYDVVSCNRFILRDDGKRYVIPKERCPKQGDVSNEIWSAIFYLTSTLMIKREFLVEMGGFDVQLGFWQEYELMMRCSQNTNVGYLEEPLILYRARKKDSARLTNNVVDWEKAVEYINHKHRVTIESLDERTRNQYRLVIAKDGANRSNNVGDKSRRRDYLKQIFLLEPNLKNLTKYVLNTAKLRFWR